MEEEEEEARIQRQDTSQCEHTQRRPRCRLVSIIPRHTNLDKECIKILSQALDKRNLNARSATEVPKDHSVGHPSAEPDRGHPLSITTSDAQHKQKSSSRRKSSRSDGKRHKKGNEKGLGDVMDTQGTKVRHVSDL